MSMNQTTAKNIDEYIARCPEDIQAILEKIRMTIRGAVPAAKEVISYQMPAFHLHGNLVYFAAWRKHIGFYPPITENEDLRHEASVYAGEKGNLQFSLDQPIPYALISKIVQHRVKQNLASAKEKAKER